MDPYAEQQGALPPRRRNGCLWGCLVTLGVTALVVAAVFTFGAWHFYKLFDNDARLQSIMSAVRSDVRAEAILGKNIKLLEVEMHTFDHSTGRGSTAKYIVRLAGSKGQGELKVDLDTSGKDAKITLMILTGPDGREHYLIGAPHPNPMMDNSI